MPANLEREPGEWHARNAVMRGARSGGGVPGTKRRTAMGLHKIDDEVGIPTWMPFAATAVVFPKLETNVIFHRRVMLAASSRLGKSNCCHAVFV